MSVPALAVPRQRPTRSRAGEARTRLAAVAHLASTVGHKARNRLALVRAGLELLTIGAESSLSPEHRTEILRQFDQFLGDFNLGLDLVRCDFGAAESGFLSAMIGEAVDAFRPHAEAAGLAMRCEFERSEPDDTVELDRRLLRLVLLNLLRNAQEAGAKNLLLRTAFRGGRVTVDVWDDGSGVAPSVTPLLFREAVTTRPDGSGLGLMLCRDAMVTMGGSIRFLRSKTGAHFRLSFLGGFPQPVLKEN